MLEPDADFGHTRASGSGACRCNTRARAAFVTEPGDTRPAGREDGERMQNTAPDRLPRDLDRLPEIRFGHAEARHLLWRAGFGGTPDQIAIVAEWGLEKAVDHLLEIEKTPHDWPAADRFDKDIMRPETAEEQLAERAARRSQDEDTLARFRLMRQQRQRQDRRQIADMQRWWLTRMIETPRPLEEKMTLFWHGHFATSYRTIEDSYHMFQQNQLFRKHAVGSFSDLLYAIIRDPAMLAYLDNNDSRVGRPNENLARELMELFGLGVGNYTEQDIKEGARALTGYTFQDNEFRFVHDNHDKGTKTILGRRGTLDGEDFVAAILAQRASSEFVATKLYDFFGMHVGSLTEDDEAAVRGVTSRMAESLRNANYNVRPVLRRLFMSRHFYHPRVMRNRIKSPVELVVGAVRSLHTPVRDLSVLLQAMDLMGQSLMFPPSVKGWDGGRSWINTSTLFVRQNLLNFLVTGRLPVGASGASQEDRYDPTFLVQSKLDSRAARRDPARVADALAEVTLGAPSEAARDALTAFAAGHGNTVDRDTVTGMLLLITAMPEYQLC